MERVTNVCLWGMTWDPQNNQNDASEQIEFALSAGINFIDTAEISIGLLLEGFFSGSEMAIVSADQLKLRHQETSGQLIHCLGERDYIVNARIELDLLCEQLDINIPIGKYTTLAEFILYKTHSIPKEGDEFKENNLSLTVHKSSAQSVLEAKISW